jgi:hypothetical protein
MTARTSPAVASKRANQAVRSRYKSLRLNEEVESPAALADRLIGILTPAAERDPGPASWAYREYVHAHFSNRFLELCARYPVPVRRHR